MSKTYRSFAELAAAIEMKIAAVAPKKNSHRLPRGSAVSEVQVEEVLDAMEKALAGRKLYSRPSFFPDGYADRPRDLEVEDGSLMGHLLPPMGKEQRKIWFWAFSENRKSSLALIIRRAINKRFTPINLPPTGKEETRMFND